MNRTTVIPIIFTAIAFLGCNERDTDLGLAWKEPSAHIKSAATSAGTLSATNLDLQVSGNSCWGNGSQEYFTVKNNDSAAVKLSDVTIKFWINDTTGIPVVPHVWYGGCVTSANGTCIHPVSGVTASASQFTSCGPDAQHQANWEITVSTTDSTTISPGNTWSNLQTGINLANFASFSPGSNTWYSPCGTGQAFHSDMHYSVYIQGQLVSTLGITAPDCRAPHGTQPIDSYTPPPATPIVGPAPATKVISLAVGLPLRNLASLQTTIAQASDPNHANYRKYLTAAQILADNSPTTTDYDTVASWATALGFKVGRYANRLVIDVTGTAAQIAVAFHANVEIGTRPDGTQYYRLDRKPSIDLAVPLLGVSGLDDYIMPMPAAGSGPGGTYQSSDLRGAYLGGPGSTCAALDGTGESIGIFSPAGFNSTDITSYQTAAGLVGVPAVITQTANDPTGLPPTAAPPLAATGNLETFEASLDIEAAMAVAPKAQIVVFEGTNTDSILTAMSNTPNVGQISSSWRVATSALTTTLLTVMAAQGQSFYTSSGDAGAYMPATFACPPATLAAIAAGTVAAPQGAGNFFRTQPFVTVVGGTVLQTAGGLWSSEVGWSGSGGGIDPGTALPAYQTGINAANAEVSTTNRNIPDLAASATNIFVVTTNCNNVDRTGVTGAKDAAGNIIATCPTAQLTGGQQKSGGGTSASTPIIAGFMALANQAAKAKGLGPLGFANPSLYAIGKDPARYAASFHDANFGSTPDTCGLAFNAQAGYDLVTGLGAPMCGLITSLMPRPSITVGAASVSGGGPAICIAGQNFTPGGTVTMTYAGIPELSGGLKTVPVTNTVTTTGSISIGDNENVFVATAVAAGAAGCTPAVIASGVVSVNIKDDATGINATATLPASLFCAVGQPSVGVGCNLPPVRLDYSQYAACTHVPLNPGLASVDFNAAYVVFQIEGYQNSSSLDFHFDPNKLFVQQGAVRHFADSTLRIYDRIFGPFAAVSSTFSAGQSQSFQVAEDIAVVVSTTTSDGSIEANQTPYTLGYDVGPNDPPVTFFKSNASRTSWPIQQDCCSIGLAVCL